MTYDIITKDQVKTACFREGVPYSDRLFLEIHFRCDSLEKKNVNENITACLQYVKAHGEDAFINEMDDLKIWDLIGKKDILPA